MTCQHVSLPGGASAIGCGPRSNQRCECRRPATLLCDWKRPNKRSGTCDAGLCERCTTKPAPGKDLCSVHARDFEAWKAGRGDASCMVDGCQGTAEVWPVIEFGKTEGGGPFRVMVPRLVCREHAAAFDPNVYVTDAAKKSMRAMTAQHGLTEPVFDDLRVEWRSAGDPDYAEVAGSGEARFIFYS